MNDWPADGEDIGFRATEAMPEPDLITDLDWRYLRHKRSLFRRYQDTFLESCGPSIVGRVVEIGGERHYGHERFFPNATEFICTNVGRDCDQYLDATQMPFADGSQDNFVCVSVAEHVYDVMRMLQEVERTLRPGGSLILTAPFAYPVHDVEDYWRFSRDFWHRSLRGFEIRRFTHLGGLLSTICEALGRPRGVVRGRFMVYKAIGTAIALALGRFDTRDSLPLGYGVHPVKRNATSCAASAAS